MAKLCHIVGVDVGWQISELPKKDKVKLNLDLLGKNYCIHKEKVKNYTLIMGMADWYKKPDRCNAGRNWKMITIQPSGVENPIYGAWNLKWVSAETAGGAWAVRSVINRRISGNRCCSSEILPNTKSKKLVCSSTKNKNNNELVFQKNELSGESLLIQG